MRKLSQIIEEKSTEVGGNAALARVLGIGTGQAIGQYIAGSMPSMAVAIKWKQVFNENLIDLIFEEGKLPMAAEPDEKYELLKKEIEQIKKQITQTK